MTTDRYSETVCRAIEAVTWTIRKTSQGYEYLKGMEYHQSDENLPPDAWISVVEESKPENVDKVGKHGEGVATGHCTEKSVDDVGSHRPAAKS